MHYAIAILCFQCDAVRQCKVYGVKLGPARVFFNYRAIPCKRAAFLLFMCFRFVPFSMAVVLQHNVYGAIGMYCIIYGHGLSAVSF